MSFSVSFDASFTLLGPKPEGANAQLRQAVYSGEILVKSYPQWFTHVAIEWFVPDSWGQCSFHVYTTPGPIDSVERLTSQPVQTQFFINPRTQETSKVRSEFYIIEAILADGTKYRSAPMSWEYKARTRTEKIASEIQRREYLLLSKFVGIKSYFFKRKRSGLRCPRCWSVSQEKVLDDKCPVCIGTSFSGGFFDPVPTFIQFDPTPNDMDNSFIGVVEPNQIGAWTISLPPMADGDVIIRTGDWAVYQVTRVSNTELQANAVKQVLTLTQLSRSDIENLLLKRPVVDSMGGYLEVLGGDFSSTRFPQSPLNSDGSDDPPWMQEQKLSNLPLKYTL